MIQTIIIAVAVIAVLLWLRRLLRMSITTTIIVGVIGALLIYLTLTGKMNWLFTLAATMVLMVARLLRSPLAFMFLGHLRRLFSRNSSGPAVFRSQFVLIRVDPFSGIIDGEVLSGQFSGNRLSQMSDEQISELLRECADTDPQAVRVLNIYLNYLRRFGFGSARGASEDVGGGIDDAPSLSLTQACEILGVGEDDDWPVISDARQRLLSRLHPDKGGSVWISQKINAAWEVVKLNHPNRPQAETPEPTRDSDDPDR